MYIYTHKIPSRPLSKQGTAIPTYQCGKLTIHKNHFSSTAQVALPTFL